MFLSAATLLPIKNLDLFTDLNSEWCAIQLKSLVLDESHVSQCYIRKYSTGISRQARERYLLHDPPQTYLTFEWLAQLDFVNLPLKIYQRQQSFHTIWIQAILVSTVISFQCILFVAKVKIKTLGITVRINVVDHWVLFLCWMWAGENKHIAGPKQMQACTNNTFMQ